MTEIFDTYSSRPSIYYILHFVTGLTFLFLFVAWQMDLKVPQKYLPFVISLLVLGIITVVGNAVVTATNIIKMYIKDGELTLSPELVIIRSIKLPLNDIKKIEIRASDFKGARTSDGSGNWMKITCNDSKTFQCKFVIKSKEQRDSLYSILNQWNKDGVSVDS